MSCKFLARRIIDFYQPHGESLNPGPILFRGSRKLGHELCRFRKVDIGGVADHVLEGTGNQIDPDIFHINKHVELGANEGTARFIGREIGMQDQKAVSADGAFRQAAGVGALAVKNVNLLVTVEKFEAADRTFSIRCGKLKRTFARNTHVGRIHQLPDAHDDFGVTDEKHIIARIAIDDLRRHSLKDTRVIDHGVDFFASRPIEPIHRDFADRLSLCRTLPHKEWGRGIGTIDSAAQPTCERGSH